MHSQMHSYSKHKGKSGTSASKKTGSSHDMRGSLTFDRKGPTQYENFLDDVFESGTRQKQMLEDGHNFQNEMQVNLGLNHDIMEQHKNNDQDLRDNFNRYIDVLKDKKSKGKYDIQDFKQNIEKGTIIDEYWFLQQMKIEDMINVPKTNKVYQQIWFDSFLRAQLASLKDTLEELGSKLFRARMTPEIEENRLKLENNIDSIIKDLEDSYIMKHDPENSDQSSHNKTKLVQLEKLVLEIQQYDAIIPSILADLMNKASEYLNKMLITTTEFQQKCDEQLQELQRSTFQNDKAFKYEFVNLGLMDPNRTRTARYTYALQNSDLLTLHEGVSVSEKIVFFLLEYFREKNNFQNLESVQEILILPSKFFECLIPPGGVLDFNNMNFKDVKQMTAEHKGMKQTIFDKYSRILIGVLLSQGNFLLVEIKTRPEHEILIYDSNYNLFSQFHEKIIRCVKAYIVEEMRDKTDLSEEDCVNYSRSYVGRSVNCPQVNFPQENGLFFCKNLQLSSIGKNVTPFSYRHDTINQLRLEIFSACLRIGVNEDRSIPFDVLL